MILYILRGVFIILAVSVTALYVLPFQEDQEVQFRYVVLMLGGTLAVTAGIVALDAGFRQKKLSAISGVFLGLIAGLLAAYALSFVVDLFGVLTAPLTPDRREAYFTLLQGVKVIIGLVTCYLGISLVIQTKDDFRFVIPYVEFAKQIRGNRPILLDTSVIVDGRVLEITETGVIQGVMIVPRFVLEELQTIADSSDKLKRARGRRGLEILQKLQQSPRVEVAIEDGEAQGVGVDQKLITLAERMQGKVMTNDFNLNKIASLRGVDVINLNDLAKALRPVVLPGEHMSVRLIKPGENPTQGVGYLEDGTMVVVEHGKAHIGEHVDLVVTSTLQTSAGRMIFGRFAHSDDDGASDGSGGPEAASSHGSRGPSVEPPQPASAARPGPASARPSARNPRRAH